MDDKKVTVMFRATTALRKEIKLQATKDDMTIQAYIEKAVIEALARDKAKAE